jgi:ribosome recycling factor
MFVVVPGSQARFTHEFTGETVIEETLLEAGEKMDKAIEVAKEDFASVRTGRANPALYSKVIVEYYGTPTPLQQLASFAVPEARTILITPYDKTALRDIEKALSDSEVGANPSNDGNVIRVVLPELTQERRKEYVKIVKGKAEDAKVSVRSIRRKAKDTLDKLVKDGEAGEDDGARGEKELDALTKQHVDAIDELLKRKEAELLEV